MSIKRYVILLSGLQNEKKISDLRNFFKNLLQKVGNFLLTKMAKIFGVLFFHVPTSDINERRRNSKILIFYPTLVSILVSPNVD